MNKISILSFVAGMTFMLGLMFARMGYCQLPTNPDDQKQTDEIETSKENSIQFATRAPTSKDKGQIWVKYTAASDTTITLYIRHSKSGVWRSVNLT